VTKTPVTSPATTIPHAKYAARLCRAIVLALVKSGA
jgi:hypothetical protein